jgi:hypothetical protein
VPAIAALLVALTLAGGGWLLGPGQGLLGQTPAVPVAGVAIPVEQAWADLIAAAGTTQTVAIPAGRYIYVRSDGEGAILHHVPWRMQRQARQSWLEPTLLRYQRIVANGKIILGTPDVGFDADPRGPIGLNNPSLEWLTMLPTNEEELSSVLLTEAEPNRGVWSTRHALWEPLSELFLKADLAVPPAVRVAIYRMLASETGLTAQVLTVGGRDVYAIGRVERDRALELLFDPATGRVVGRRSLYLGDEDPGVTPDRVMSWSIWEQKVVSAVGRTD